MDWAERELQRFPDDGMIGGVCAGLARYFGVDVSLVRAAFIASLVFGGFGLAAYVALWVLVDRNPVIKPPCEVGVDAEAEADDLLPDLSQNPVVVDD